MASESFVPLTLGVVTVSDTRTLETDRSGALAEDTLRAAGHVLLPRRVVRDDIAAIRALLTELIDELAADVVIVTGGTGLTTRDVTPEALSALVTKPIPGFGELFRALSYAEIGASTIQSRAEAALCGRALVFSLPGSPNAVRLALDKIILSQLDARTRPCNFAELLPRMRSADDGKVG
jgi:molybdopterin adenylyltransferase